MMEVTLKCCEEDLLRVNAFTEGLWQPLLYGCETRSLTLREEHRLRVFENRVLR
jgi:hypothetical protein